MPDPVQQKRDEAAVLPVPAGATSAPLVASIRTGEPSPTSIRPPEVEAGQLDKHLELQWKFAEAIHQYVRDYIRQADQKAAFFFAGATALIAFLYKSNLVHLWLKPSAQWLFGDVVSFIATTALAVSALASAAAILPRLRGSKRGIVFFSAIAECQSTDEYLSEVRKRSTEELLDDKLSHVHELARVCHAKYSVLKVGLWSAAVGVAAAVLLFVLAG